MTDTNRTPLLLVFETHPVQYRAPVFRELERVAPGAVRVIYASDYSVRGYRDEGFGRELSWDVPLLEGYEFTVLDTRAEGGLRQSGWLGDRGIDRALATFRPKAILLHQLYLGFNLAVYLAAVRRRIPVWLRVDTSDHVFARRRVKEWMRSTAYRLIYRGVSRAFCVGEATREHMVGHGVPERKLRTAHHCTPDPLARLTVSEKQARRTAKRQELGFAGQDFVVAFFGKLIPKKNPALLQAAWTALPDALRIRTRLLYVGSGELEGELRRRNEEMNKLTDHDVTKFAGFVNQAAISDYYLAADVLVLPSRRMGETWGLVVNEGLQAGCAVVVSDAVGCGRDFGGWERVRVIPEGDSAALAASLDALSRFPRDFTWAAEGMKDYTIEAAAAALATEIKSLGGVTAPPP